MPLNNGQLSDFVMRWEKHGLVSHPVTVHVVDKVALAVAQQNIGDVAKVRRHTTVLIVGTITQVGPGYVSR